jgi:OOP family OmpA-OmpF porin
MSFRIIAAAALLCAAAGVTPAAAQFGKLGRKLKEKAEERVDRRTDEAAEKAVDTADPTEKVGRSGTQDGAPEPAEAEPASAAAAETVLRPGEGAWANYDFKPGDRPLFTDDFTRDEVGDFPRRLDLKEGNMEVVEWQGRRLLRATSFGGFFVPLPETLPERFTVEFDYHGSDGWYLGVHFAGAEEGPSGEHHYVAVRVSDGGVEGRNTQTVSAPGRNFGERVFPVRIMADSRYVKVYMDDKRVANVPNAHLGRANRIYFDISADQDAPALFGPIRVMAGGKKLYDALLSDGRVATQGIYFATDSDRIRPESSATLKEIGLMLKEHADLRLAIEGHTDDVGRAEPNRLLSERRAAAVRQYLVSTYGIAAARLESRGLGSTKPAAKNDTPEGRQQNRRVELVRL